MITREEFLRLSGLDVANFDRRMARGQIAGMAKVRPNSEYAEFDALSNRFVTCLVLDAGAQLTKAVQTADRLRPTIIKNWGEIVSAAKIIRGGKRPDHILCGSCWLGGDDYVDVCGTPMAVGKQMADCPAQIVNVCLGNISLCLAFLLDAAGKQISLDPQFLTFDYQPPPFSGSRPDPSAGLSDAMDRLLSERGLVKRKGRPNRSKR